MASQLLDFRHGRVLPKDQLVLGIAVGRAKFTLMLTPDNRTDLAASINAVEHGARRGIPKFNAAVGRTASTRQEPTMKGTPVQGLDGSLVLLENETRRLVILIPLLERRLPRHGRIPKTHSIIVAATGETRSVIVPFEAAYFLFVLLVLGDNVQWRTNVVIVNHGVPTPRSQPVLVPCHGRDATRVTRQGTNLAQGLRVHNVNDRAVGSDGNVRSLTWNGTPRDARDIVVGTVDSH